MEEKYFSGVWATMVTPFDSGLRIRYDVLERMVEWYIQRGIDGLFAVCQSSEMEWLNPEECRKICGTVVNTAGGRIPVVASGYIAETMDGQLKNTEEIYESGVDAVVLVSNRFIERGESDSVFLRNLECFLEKIDPTVPLGIYECPTPFKWLLTEKSVEYCAKSKRFMFFKDTSCHSATIRKRLKITRNTPLKLFNANAATFLQSLWDGVDGYCGVMANFHPELYGWLYRNFASKPELAQRISDFLAVSSACEGRMYPDNAKYYLQKWIPGMETVSRKWCGKELPESFRLEVESMEELAEEYRRLCGIFI